MFACVCVCVCVLCVLRVLCVLVLCLFHVWSVRVPLPLSRNGEVERCPYRLVAALAIIWIAIARRTYSLVLILLYLVQTMRG